MGANTYLTERERRILESAKVGIAGAGGLGSNVAMLLVRAGMKKLVIEVMLNTSGARNAAEAVRIAKIGKAAGFNWLKVEIHPDARYLLPDPVETLKAVEECAKFGMVVLPYINADPVLARHCEDAGAAAVIDSAYSISNNFPMSLRAFGHGIICLKKAGAGTWKTDRNSTETLRRCSRAG